MYDLRRRRLAAPMYEVQHARRPQAAARQLLMYDVGCTMYDCDVRALCAGKRPSAVSAYALPAGRTADGAAVSQLAIIARFARGSGGGENAAYVRCTTYDVQHARRPKAAARQLPMYDFRCTMYDGGRRGLPMYEVRCTMYDLGSSRACARMWRLVPPMYDVRWTTEALDSAHVRCTTEADGVCPCTMYDCDYSALCAGQQSKCERDVLKP